MGHPGPDDSVLAMEQPVARRRAPWRGGLVWVLLVLGCVVLLVANLAVFARTFLFDTDTFADALAPEQPDEDVIAGVADTLSDQIVAATAVQDRIEELTPSDNPLVAATVSDAARGLIGDTVRTVLQSDVFRDLWRSTVVRAHDRMVQLIEGDQREPVLLDLRGAVEQVDQRLEGRGIDLIDDATVERVSSVVALRRAQIDDLRSTVDLVRRLVVALPIVALALLAVAVALAPDRRRVLARVGIGVVVAMAVTAVVLRIARRMVTDRVEVDVRRDAVQSLWGRLFETLVQQTAALAALGLVIALGAWLAGPSRLAVGVRSRVSGRSGGQAPAGEPSALARLIGAHRTGFRMGILAAAVVALLLVPGPSALAVVVVAVLTLAAVVAVELLAGPAHAPA